MVVSSVVGDSNDRGRQFREYQIIETNEPDLDYRS